MTAQTVAIIKSILLQYYQWNIIIMDAIIVY